MRRGEIYRVCLDPTEGHEQQGYRPVLVVSPDRFNQITRLPIVVPITSGGHFARTAGFTVPIVGAGIRTTGVARCDQPRPLDLLARKAQKVEKVSQETMDEVLAKVRVLFE